MNAESIVNHLWQSSCFALFAGMLAFMLRGHSPKARYWVWLSASLKFLVPWVLLVRLGSTIPRPAGSSVSFAPSYVRDALLQIADPFSVNPAVTHQTQTEHSWGLTALAFLWAIGFIALAFRRFRDLYRVRAMLRVGTPVKLSIAVPTFVTPATTEPGIVGFLRPILILPAQLLERLNQEQVEALLAHEWTHLRRRDNLFAALHMGVETIFWFHPMVWWIGSHLLEERELACDEEVLRLGHKPTAYARGILSVCEHYSETPIACISGVTGADVKKRVTTILQGTLARELRRRQKMVLTLVALRVIAGPIGIGIWSTPAAHAQSAAFEVTSVKPLTPKPLGFQGVQPACRGGHFRAITPVFLTLAWAYDLQTAQQMAELREKLPQWAQSISGSYELEATTRSDVTEEECRKMAQKLFEDRFHFKYHWETVTGKVYEMVVARGGFKMQPADPGDPTSNLSITINGRLAQPPPSDFPVWQGTTMDDMAVRLSAYPEHIPVINKTGIQGKYKLKLTYSAGPALNADFADPDMITAVEQQLGLKLQEARGPVAHFDVESIEKPDEN